jgi:long-chain acyl-CoA synthetase
MIISGGENIYPAEVEHVLVTHPEIAAAAVIGVPHARWGETVLAVIVPLPDTDPSAQGIIDYTRAHLAHYKCPTIVRFVTALPENASGKVLRRRLRELADAESWATSVSSSTVTRV